MNAGIASKGALAVFLSFLLAASVAHAQGGPPGDVIPKQLVVALSDGFSLTDVVAVSYGMVTRSIADSLSVDDKTSTKSVTAFKILEADKVTLKDSAKKRLHAFRFAFDNLSVGDPLVAKGPSAIAISNPIGITDEITLSGALAPRSAPIVSLQPGPPAVFSPDGDGTNDLVEIAFDSTARGTYVFQIRDAQGGVASSLTGAMNAGRNAVTWDGTDASGNTVPAGTYTYYISARSEGGVREPPSEGDGIIVVESPSALPAFLPELNYTTLILAVAVAAGGTGLLLFLRRRKELVLYLPVAASDVIGEIKQKYPSATIEDFIEPVDGGSKLYKGVKIENPGKEDENWFADVIKKAKRLAGVDSVNVSYGGKVRAI